MPEITSSDVGTAWSSAILLASTSKKKEVGNLIVNINPHGAGISLGPALLQNRLDAGLEDAGCFSTATVSNTIFPRSLWRQGMKRDDFFDRYMSLWPRISAHRQNRRGTYFQRLIGYPRPGEPTFNQLEHVISAYTGGTRRRSAMQCSILCPPIDLNATPYQGFPCMQQVSFHPEGRNGLRISALYPMHYLWARAYGNYWGLLNLGTFMAQEMGLELCGMTCIALIAKLERPSLALNVLEAQ